MSVAMMPRGRIDIGWGDLVYGALSCLRPGRREVAERRVLEAWGAGEGTMVCLSIRSAFDLYLRTMAFPKGSEILVTAVTIRDMVRIIEHHGLVPVPIDVDMDTLTVKPEALRRAVTPRSRAVLAAHLFGAVMPLDETAAFAREHGLHLLEDCAQSFTGLDHQGHPESDLTFFSFGPIKTATALGGAVVRVRDPELKRRMAEGLAREPVQSRARFLRRTLRFMVVRSLLNPRLFGLFYRACRLLGANHDDVVNHSIRGFSGPAFFTNIRHRPSRPLLALLRRRLVRFDRGIIEARIRTAARALELMPDLERPGTCAAEHSFWTFPVSVEDPDDFCEHLWSRGFDATRGKWSLYTVPGPADGSRAPAAEAGACMRRVVYIPVVHPRMRARDLERLAAAVREWVEGQGGPALDT